MKARCPRSPEHKRFVTVAHIAQDWIVDENGDFIEEVTGGCEETVHGPNPDNTWTCVACGAAAIVER